MNNKNNKQVVNILNVVVAMVAKKPKGNKSINNFHQKINTDSMIILNSQKKLIMMVKILLYKPQLGVKLNSIGSSLR